MTAYLHTVVILSIDYVVCSMFDYVLLTIDYVDYIDDYVHLCML